MLAFKRFLRMQIRGTRSASFNENRQAKMLQKLIDTGEVKKKKRSNKSEEMTSQSFACLGDPEFSSRRLSMLNKTYLIHISQVMACGKNADRLQSFGIEVTGVKTDKSLQNIKIFWFTRNSTAEVEEINGVLKSTAAELQYELNSSRVMGKCPDILFVRDVTSEKLQEIDNIFNTLSLSKKGDPAEPSTNENETTKSVESGMKHNVLGLDHSKIMDRIKSKIRHKEAISIRDSEQIPIEKRVVQNSHLIPFSKSAYSKFYKKQKTLNGKRWQLSSTEDPDNSTDAYYEDEPYTKK